MRKYQILMQTGAHVQQIELETSSPFRLDSYLNLFLFELITGEIVYLNPRHVVQITGARND